MPDFSDDFNPFSSPLEVEVVEPPKRSPGGVTAICIIAIVLGGFGLLAALLSGVGLFSGLQAQAALGPQPVGVSPEMEQIQERMRTEMAPVMCQYMILASLPYCCIFSVRLSCCSVAS